MKSLQKLLLLTFLFPLGAGAATLTWDIAPGTIGVGDSAITGGTSDWNLTNGNWTTNAGANNLAWVNNVTPDSATFQGTAGTVTLTNPITANTLNFSTTGYTVTGGTLTLGGATPTVNVPALAATINSSIAGSAGLIVRTTSTTTSSLTLGGSVSNSYTGDTYIRHSTSANNADVRLILSKTGGAVAVNGLIYLGTNLERPRLQTTQNNQFGPNALIAVNTFNVSFVELQGTAQTVAGIYPIGGKNNLVISGSETANFGAGSVLTVNNSANYTAWAAIKNGFAGNVLSLVKDGAATWTLGQKYNDSDGGASNQTQYTGTTAVNGGVLELNAYGGANQSGTYSSTYSGGTITINNGATLRITRSAGSGVYQFSGKTIQFGAGGGTLDGAVSNVFRMTGGNLFATTASGADSFITGSLDLYGQTATFDVAASSGLQASANLINGTGSGNVLKNGTGTLTLTGTNNYSGTTNISAGTLQIGDGGTTGSLGTGGIVTNSAALTFNRSNDLTVANVINGSGTVTKNGGGVLSLSSTTSAYTGATLVNAGTLNVAKLAVGGSNSSIGAAAVTNSNLVLNGGTLQYNANTAPQTTNRLFSIGTNGATFDSSSTTAGNTMSFTGTGAIGTTGSGTRLLTLTGSNTGDNTMAPSIGDGTGGSTSLTKSGAGTWVLSGTSNEFTGGVTLTGGTLSVPTVADTGFAQPLGMGASPITFDGNNATLKITGNGSTNRGLQLGANNYTSRLEVDAGVAPTVTLSGSITGGSSGGAFTKAGNGIFNFSGSGNWNGALNVTGGQFNVTSTGSINGPNNEGIGVVELTNGSTFNINTSTQVKASSIAITSGAVNLNAGTLRTNGITGASAFTWGAGTLTVQNADSGSSGSTDRTGTNGSGGAASGPVIYEGTVLNVNNGAGTLATSSGSILDLGGLYTSGVLRYDQLKVTGALNLTETGDTLNIAISPYRLRPSGPNDVATGDWGTLRLVLADSFTMNGLEAYKFDQVTGITSDMIGWTSAGTGTNTNTNPFNLAMDTYFIEYRTSGVQSGAAILFHYKVSGSVPEPASAGLLVAGALLLRALRRRK